MSERPKALFKYVHPDRIDILEKLQIRFTQPSCFNDPFEACPAISDLNIDDLENASQRFEQNLYLRYKLRGGPKKYEDFKRIQSPHTKLGITKLFSDPSKTKERLMAKLIEKWDQIIGILSLTETENNNLMWAHYTNSHKGMLIEFDVRHSFFNPPSSPKTDFGVPMAVHYPISKRRPEYKGSSDPMTEIQMIKTKGAEWSYEHEWRVFQPLDKSDEKIPLANETIHLIKLPPKAIKRVVMGCRMDFKTRQNIKQIKNSNPELRHLQIHEAVRKLDEFGFDYVPLRYDF